MLKIILYMFFFLFTIWAMEGINFNSMFKQSRVYQARIIYIMLAISISYLVTNFVYDFCLSFNFVK